MAGSWLSCASHLKYGNDANSNEAIVPHPTLNSREPVDLDPYISGSSFQKPLFNQMHDYRLPNHLPCYAGPPLVQDFYASNGFFAQNSHAHIQPLQQQSPVPSHAQVSAPQPVCINSSYRPRVSTLSQHWNLEMNEFEREIQVIEHEKGNINIKVGGITRKIISSDHYLPSNSLNSVASYQPFKSESMQAFFHNIHVAFIGDSLIRSLYKDFVHLLSGFDDGRLVPEQKMKWRTEESYFVGERLLQHDDPADKKEFVEYREYMSDNHWVEFLFTTRVFNDKIEMLLSHFEKNPPDVVVLHSNIWDATRYSQDDRVSLTQFALRLGYLCTRLKEILEPTAVVIFVIFPPPMYESATANGVAKGFLAENVADMNKMAKFTSLAINYFAAQIMFHYGFDVLDLNYHFQQDEYAAFRAPDGLHFVSLGVRLMTQILVGHILKAWDVDLPLEVLDRLEFFKDIEGAETSDQWKSVKEALDDIEGIPSCYKRLMKKMFEEYGKIDDKDETVNKDGARTRKPSSGSEKAKHIPMIIKEDRLHLMKHMKDFVNDPFWKQYVEDFVTQLPSSSTPSTSKPISAYPSPHTLNSTLSTVNSASDLTSTASQMGTQRSDQRASTVLSSCSVNIAPTSSNSAENSTSSGPSTHSAHAFLHITNSSANPILTAPPTVTAAQHPRLSAAQMATEINEKIRLIKKTRRKKLDEEPNHQHLSGNTQATAESIESSQQQPLQDQEVSSSQPTSPEGKKKNIIFVDLVEDDDEEKESDPKTPTMARAAAGQEKGHKTSDSDVENGSSDQQQPRSSISNGSPSSNSDPLSRLKSPEDKRLMDEYALVDPEYRELLGRVMNSAKEQMGIDLHAHANKEQRPSGPTPPTDPFESSIPSKSPLPPEKSKPSGPKEEKDKKEVIVIELSDSDEEPIPINRNQDSRELELSNFIGDEKKGSSILNAHNPNPDVPKQAEPAVEEKEKAKDDSPISRGQDPDPQESVPGNEFISHVQDLALQDSVPPQPAQPSESSGTRDQENETTPEGQENPMPANDLDCTEEGEIKDGEQEDDDVIVLSDSDDDDPMMSHDQDPSNPGPLNRGHKEVGGVINQYQLVNDEDDVIVLSDSDGDVEMEDLTGVAV